MVAGGGGDESSGDFALSSVRMARYTPSPEADYAVHSTAYHSAREALPAPNDVPAVRRGLSRSVERLTRLAQQHHSRSRTEEELELAGRLAAELRSHLNCVAALDSALSIEGSLRRLAEDEIGSQAKIIASLRAELADLQQKVDSLTITCEVQQKEHNMSLELAAHSLEHRDRDYEEQLRAIIDGFGDRERGHLEEVSRLKMELDRARYEREAERKSRLENAVEISIQAQPRTAHAHVQTTQEQQQREPEKEKEQPASAPPISPQISPAVEPAAGSQHPQSEEDRLSLAEFKILSHSRIRHLCQKLEEAEINNGILLEQVESLLEITRGRES
jgi:hypothetical protein